MKGWLHCTYAQAYVIKICCMAYTLRLIIKAVITIIKPICKCGYTYIIIVRLYTPLYIASTGRLKLL